MFRSLRMRLLAGAAALLVLGLVVGWVMADDGSSATKLAVPAEAWKDPALQRSETPKYQAALQEHSLWGDVAPVAAAADAQKAGPSSWKLVGIFAEGGPPVAVILVTAPGAPGPKEQLRKSGDELPDGSRIVEIAKTTMTVADSKGQRQVKLFFPN